ncbi:hypothetical protein SAMN05216374_0979 [Tardiphaga sp. OK246]|uniref:hypothetical protein n=1 Tax=Tardiphaga sp. OK246 TaxID=1855307 RepID=UPI000B62D5B8|nr:hypothetical protein [Tardiphaga sp. OK246]SNS36253.1 hypothetical protein SAMN05216374_0979 [Tardiphaga sp. OK246]
MPVVVIEPPELVVTAGEARTARVFTEDDDDEYVEHLLEIAQSEIDGPPGWLGRSIGVQTLQLTLPFCANIRPECLPYRPVIEILSDVLSEDGCHRIVEYRAGQEIDDVPRRIKHAIIMMAGTLRDATPDEGGTLKKKTVDGVGSREYTLPDGAADAMKNAAERLLATYQVYA